MRSLVLLLLLSGCAGSINNGSTAGPVNPVEIETTVMLIGDAGAPTPGDPVLAALTQQVALAPSRTVVVFLGDNIYPRGMPEPGDATRADAERRIDAQVEAARAAHQVIFVPGNHDWDRFGVLGLRAIRRQGEYLAAGGRATLLPRDGCPGPVMLDLSPHLRLLAIDSQWWLQGESRSDSLTACEPGTPAAVVAAIRTDLATAGGRIVVVAAHHPLASSGGHGGRFTWMDHLFPLRSLHRWMWLPLPAVGSLYPLMRSRGISAQDHSSTAYQAFAAALDSAFTPDPPLVYAAGHEHALEVHVGPSASYALVSGAGAWHHEAPIRPRSDVLFGESRGGFMKLDVMMDGRVRLAVIALSPDGHPAEAWSKWIR